jgi:hypothetical protein
LGILIAGTVLLVGSAAWWVAANYRIQRKGESSFGPQWHVPPAETVSGRRYLNEHVDVDGKTFDHCHFTNVTLRFRGTAPFQFHECRLTGEVFFITDHPAVKAALSYGNMVRQYTQSAPPGVKASFGFGVKDARGNVTATMYDKKGDDAPAAEASPSTVPDK